MVKGSLNPGLYDPRRGDQAIRTQRLDLNRKPFEPARTNYFSVYLIEAGSGTFWADASHFAFGPGSLLFFVPYQHIRFVPDAPIHAEVIQFHANFLCVETFHAEVGCSGVLFNDPYGIPVVVLDGGTLMKACINCAFSDYSPVGHGLFGGLACFRGNKAGYRGVTSKGGLFKIWDTMTEFVQETYLCPEFEKRAPGTGYRG